MAKIVEYKKGESYSLSARHTEPTEVNCIYDVQTLNDGSKCLVVKTYNPNSVNAGISQVIHFTEESARKLIEIFKKELNI